MSSHSLHAAATRKAMIRLMPLLGIAYMMSYIDRTNVALVKTRLETDIGLDAAAYGLGAGLFFLTYALLEVPSNLLMRKVGARVWITRIAVTWGLICAAMMFVHGPTSFYVLRLLLGAAEAGFFPAMMYYITLWFAAKQRAMVVGLLYAAAALGGVIGGPISGGLLTMHGLVGLAGWQWMFLVEGLVTAVMGLFIWFMLPNRPEEARWLSAEEARVTSAAAEAAAPDSPDRLRGNLMLAFASPIVVLVAGIYFFNQFLATSIGFNTPAIIEAAGLADPSTTGLITGGIALGGLIGVLVFPWFVKRGAREITLIVLCAVASTLLTIGYVFIHVPIVQLVILFGENFFVLGTLPLFWSLAMHYMSGLMAAAGLAFINTIGLLGSFVRPSIYGAVEQNMGAAAPFVVLIGVGVVGTAFAVGLFFKFRGAGGSGESEGASGRGEGESASGTGVDTLASAAEND